jgi:hypothetical protein
MEVVASWFVLNSVNSLYRLLGWNQPFFDDGFETKEVALR